jgi:hypothetical protein
MSCEDALEAALRRIAELELERERFQRAALDNESAAKRAETLVEGWRRAYGAYFDVEPLRSEKIDTNLCNFPGCIKSRENGEYCEEHFGEKYFDGLGDCNAE